MKKYLEFEPRVLCPTGNPYYITIGAGGYSPCIVGKPKMKNADVLANCVGYAVGRFNEIAQTGDCHLLQSTDAENFIEIAKKQGLIITQDPVIGGCMCWSVGEIANGKDGHGHVAIVERWWMEKKKIFVSTSESGYNHYAFRRQVRSGKNWSQGKSYAYRGCIVNPACTVSRSDIPTTTIRYMEHSDAVAWMQYMLFLHGYDCGSAGIDGNFGRRTRNALGLFQLDHGLVVDHVCGHYTKTELCKGVYVCD